MAAGMTRNLTTSLRQSRVRDPMREFDRLPPALRRWLAEAALPWSARSVRTAWHKALRASGGCEHRARMQMDEVEARLIARDARKVWDGAYPLLDAAIHGRQNIPPSA